MKSLILTATLLAAVLLSSGNIFALGTLHCDPPTTAGNSNTCYSDLEGTHYIWSNSGPVIVPALCPDNFCQFICQSTTEAASVTLDVYNGSNLISSQTRQICKPCGSGIPGGLCMLQ